MSSNFPLPLEKIKKKKKIYIYILKKNKSALTILIFRTFYFSILFWWTITFQSSIYDLLLFNFSNIRTYIFHDQLNSYKQSKFNTYTIIDHLLGMYMYNEKYIVHARDYSLYVNLGSISKSLSRNLQSNFFDNHKMGYVTFFW